MKGKKAAGQSTDSRQKEESKGKPPKKSGGMFGFLKNLGGNAFKKKKNQMITDNKLLLL